MVGDQIFVGGSHMRSRNWSPSAYVRPDLRDTLEKMTCCSRANPSLLVSPVLVEPKVEQLSPALHGLSLPKGT